MLTWRKFVWIVRRRVNYTLGPSTLTAQLQSCLSPQLAHSVLHFFQQEFLQTNRIYERRWFRRWWFNAFVAYQSEDFVHITKFVLDDDTRKASKQAVNNSTIRIRIRSMRKRDYWITNNLNDFVIVFGVKRITPLKFCIQITETRWDFVFAKIQSTTAWARRNIPWTIIF